MPRKQLLKANYETRLKLSDTMEHFIFSQAGSRNVRTHYKRLPKNI